MLLLQSPGKYHNRRRRHQQKQETIRSSTRASILPQLLSTPAADNQPRRRGSTPPLSSSSFSARSKHKHRYVCGCTRTCPCHRIRSCSCTAKRWREPALAPRLLLLDSFFPLGCCCCFQRAEEEEVCCVPRIDLVGRKGAQQPPRLKGRETDRSRFSQWPDEGRRGRVVSSSNITIRASLERTPVELAIEILRKQEKPKEKSRRKRDNFEPATEPSHRSRNKRATCCS